MPGAEVKQTDATNYEGTLTVKVVPIGASFGGSVTLTHLDETFGPVPVSVELSKPLDRDDSGPLPRDARGESKHGGTSVGSAVGLSVAMASAAFAASYFTS